MLYKHFKSTKLLSTNLVEARSAAAAAGDIEAAAEGRSASDGGEGAGLRRVEDRVGLGVALPAGRAL